MIVIYKITSIKNPKKFYIGSAVNYKNRVDRHLYSLKTKCHKNKILQNHYDKYGVEDLQFSIIEIVESTDELLKREQFYIDLLSPTINICKIAGNSFGVKRSDEFKAKISLSKKGKKHRPECSAEKSIRQMGKKSALGYIHTEEARLKISENNAKKRAVIQLDENDLFIKEWESMLQAANYFKIKYQGISMCCRGLIKKTAGYKWKYKN